MKNKKASVMIWVLVIVILLLLGGVIWFIFGGDGGSSLGLGSSIPQPPALPE